jgi:hypothetical protein
MAENSKIENGLITQQIYGGVAQKYTHWCDNCYVALAKDTADVGK